MSRKNTSIVRRDFLTRYAVGGPMAILATKANAAEPAARSHQG